MVDKDTGTSINIKKHLPDYMEFISFVRWYPDVFIDLIKPEANTINLGLDQRVMMRSIMRFYSTYGVFPRAYGKCVAGDTILFTEDGMKEIESLFNLPKTNIEMPVPTNISMVNLIGETERSLVGLYDGYKITNKIKTREGYSLEATPDHPVLVIDTDGKIKWRKTKDLKIGDYLCINRNNDVWGDKTDLDSVEFDKKTIPNCIMNSTKENVASFIRGLFDKDGAADERCIFYVTTSEKMAKQVQIVLLNFGIISKRVHNVQSYIVSITDENIYLFQKEIGFGLLRKKKSVEKLLDKKRNVNKNIVPHQKSLIEKFFNKERELGFYNTKCFDDLYNVRVGNNELSYDRVQKILDENINMIGTEEYSVLEDIKELNYFYAQISSIEKSANFVYDVNMPNTHSFISNGIVSHNTFLEVLCMLLVAIFYPNAHLSLTAQTKENAASILQEKYLEIIKFYPLLENEILGKPKFSKNIAEINVVNGAKIDILANAQSSKGQRRARVNVEESALLKSALFEDVIEPIPAMPRLLPNGESDPCEMNSQINFFTTAGYKGSDEFSRVIKTYRNMIDLEGKIFLGSSWLLPCFYRRGPNKDQMLQKREDINPIAFSQNYMSHWVGNSDGALVDIQKLMDCRTIDNPEFSNTNYSEYVLGVDVARSLKLGNNISSVAVIKIVRNKDLKIKELHLVNIYEISGNKNFQEQAAIIKRIQKNFQAKVVCIDTNGLGIGLLDELGKLSYDMETGEPFSAWKTMNTDFNPSEQEAEPIVFDLKPQSANNAIIVNFIGMVDGGKLKMIIKKANEDYSLDSYDNQSDEILPYVLTDLLVDEIANLKMKILPSGQLTVDRVITRMGKDKFSALAYGLWYAKTFEDMEYTQDDIEDILSAIIF